jgi:hypothetical protein
LVFEFPDMPATVIAERLGYDNGVSSSVFRARVSQVKKELVPPDPADRLGFAVGEQVQCDLWFPDQPITGVKRPVLTMVACWSRFLAAVMIPSRQCGDILAGMNLLLPRIGGLPKQLLWDNETGIVNRRKLVGQAAAWAGGLGATVRLARPRDPETKGRVERVNGFLDKSFQIGRVFTGIDDFNDQLDEWVTTRANTRYHQAAGGRPGDLIAIEREALIPLPGVMPKAVISGRYRVGRDYYLRVDTNDYSIHPGCIGHFVDLETTLTRVQGFRDGQLVCDHPRNLERHQVITDPAHVTAARQLREAFQAQQATSRNRYGHLSVVETRDLADYDRLYQQGA